MCGICCVFYSNSSSSSSKETYKADIEEKSRLSRRGPDCSQTCQIDIGSKHKLLFSGHVLHLRGDLTPQPKQDENGNILLWNGEVFGGIEIKEDENDTDILLTTLSSSTDIDHILTTMSKIQGPWAFVYWQEARQCLWFGRDMFGRRSLLWHFPQNSTDPFILISTQLDNIDFQEVPCIGLFCIDLSKPVDRDDNGVGITLYTRKDAVWPGSLDKVESDPNFQERILNGHTSQLVSIILDTDHKLPIPMPILNKCIPCIGDEDASDGSGVATANSGELHHQGYIENLAGSDNVINKLADQLISILQKAVMTRVYNQPDLKVHPCSQCKPQTSSSLTKGNNSSRLKRRIYSSKLSDDISDSSDRDDDICFENNSSVTKLGGASPETADNNILNTVHAMETDCQQRHAKVAILFSGGIDSAVITALVDKCIPIEEPVDLLNVAFEQQVKQQPNKKSKPVVINEKEKWNVPDRITGYSALGELNPNRQWNFVEVNVTLAELKDVRSAHVRHLVYPLETVLDDSIGCAVWFAARGQGIISNGELAGQPYTSKARVILCGMGADEQLGGYSRHRGKYNEQGWQGLLDEMNLEITRISARNLGRDDRIITDHGKEARFPFLDETVVDFLSSLPIECKVNLDLPRGIGEKLLLRVCANKLGLKTTAVLPKRAIQFGSRIAKTENHKEKASDTCNRLKE